MDIKLPITFTLDELITFAKSKNIYYNFNLYYNTNKYGDRVIIGYIFSMKNIYNTVKSEYSHIRFNSFSGQTISNNETMFFLDRFSEETYKSHSDKNEEIKVCNYIKNELTKIK